MNRTTGVCNDAEARESRNIREERAQLSGREELAGRIGAVIFLALAIFTA